MSPAEMKAAEAAAEAEMLEAQAVEAADALDPEEETLAPKTWVSLALFGVLVAGLLGCSWLQPWNWFS